MFSKDMKKAVDAVQQIIKTCNSTDNIAMAATENINKYVKYIDELDPTNIAFEKTGLLNKFKIKGYWLKVAEYYPAMSNLLAVLEENQRVLKNTQSTLEIKRKSFEKALVDFKLLADSSTGDMEYMQQAIVVENTHCLLLSTIDEYANLERKVNSILGLSKQVLDAAMLIAKNTYKIAVNTENTITGIADIAIYKRDFAVLKGLF